MSAEKHSSPPFSPSDLLPFTASRCDEEIEPVQVGRYKLNENEIVGGDCRKILPRIKDHTFHAVITDPANGIGQTEPLPVRKPEAGELRPLIRQANRSA